MPLLTADITQQLRDNARLQDAHPGDDPLDFAPVVKLFTPHAGGTWLLTELHEDDLAFGLCDLGMGFPELGYVSLAELEALRTPFGRSVERDEHFVAVLTLSQYHEGALRVGHISV